MSNLQKTDAVVLRSMKYRESSRLITLFTREFGRVTGIVKGARQSRARFGAALDPLSHVSVILSRKVSRDIQTVTGCEMIEYYRSLREDLEKMSLGMQVVELQNHVSHPDEPNPSLFALLVQTLSMIDTSVTGARTLVHAYQLHLARLSGFTPVFDACAGCGGIIPQDRSVLFVPGRGGTVCDACGRSGERGVRLTPDARNALIAIAGTDIVQLSGLDYPRSLSDEIDSVLWLFLQTHITGLKRLRSRAVFNALEGVVGRSG